MSDEEYRIIYCWNGSKHQVYLTETYDSKNEWEFAVEGLPFDFIDGNDTTVWVDYGDND